jgi:nucleotide-binding universal stress UspA family protein
MVLWNIGYINGNQRWPNSRLVIQEVIMIKKKNSTRAKFLVYVDENEFSHTAVRLACSKATIKNRTVEMIFVIDPKDYNSVLGADDVMKHERKKEVQKLLKTLAERAKKWSGITPAIHIEEGDPEEELFKCIEKDNDINMLIISSSPSEGSGGKKLLGDLAEALDERFHIPMMVVPANITDEEIKELS